MDFPGPALVPRGRRAGQGRTASSSAAAYAARSTSGNGRREPGGRRGRGREAACGRAEAAGRKRTATRPGSAAVHRLPPDVRQDAQKQIDAVFVATPNHHHAPAGDDRHAIGQGRVLREAAVPRHRRSPPAGRNGPPVQVADADGQPGPLRGRLPPALRIRLGRRDRQHHRDAQLDRPRQRRQRPAPATQPVARRPALGRVDRPGAVPRVTTTTCTRTNGTGGTTSATARWATWAATCWTASSGR